MGAKGKVGKWVPPDLVLAETIAERCVAFDMVAKVMGICPMTLRKHRRANEAFNAALERGRAKGALALANKAFEIAMVDRDPSMVRFLCRATGVIDDRIRVEHRHVGADGGPIAVEVAVYGEIDVKPTQEVLRLMESYAHVARAALAGAADAGDVAGE